MRTSCDGSAWVEHGKLGHAVTALAASAITMQYEGKERRRRFVYTTRNTEYHVFDDVCVGVRDRKSRRWHRRHAARGLRLEGGIVVHSNGAVVPTLERPHVGGPMFFHVNEDEQIVTSRLEAIGRPEGEDLKKYGKAS